MESARVAARFARPAYYHVFRRAYHKPARVLNGLRPVLADMSPRNHRLRKLPLGANFLHNFPAVRNASFARVLPKLAMKLVRIPAMAGGAMLGGLAYLQYQAARK